MTPLVADCVVVFSPPRDFLKESMILSTYTHVLPARCNRDAASGALKYPLFPEGTKFPWLHILIHQWCPAYAGMPAIEPRHRTYSAAHSMSVERWVQFWRQPDILLITDVTPSASFFARNICLDAKGWTHLKIRVFVLHCITKQW